LPLLRGFPVSETPRIPDTTRLDTRTLAFRTLDGDYPFPATGREFFFMPDLDGLDLVDPEIIYRTVPGMDGALISEIRTPVRELSLPLFLSSDSSHAHYLDYRDALAGLFTRRRVDYRRLGGTFDLVASSLRGERYLRCTYTGGMKAIKRPGEGSYWAKLPISAVAVQPYWVGEGWETPVLRQPDDPDFFASFPGELSSSMALGTFPLTVAGDVDSWPTFDIIGPSTSVTVSSSSGLSFTIPAALASGEVVQVVTDPRARTALFDGVKDWARVGATTTWRPLPPGDQELTVAVTGTSTNTQVQVRGSTFWERPW
jgi:hypothetical protein